MKIIKGNIFLFICLLLVAVNFCYSQSGKADSLKAAISIEKNDSLKVTQLVSLFELYQRQNNTSECKKIADEALSLSAGSKNKTVIGLSNLIKGINFKELEDYPNAQTFLLIALKNLDSKLNTKALGDANSYMGYIQEQMNQFDKAIVYHRTALKLRSEIGEKVTSNSYLRLAGCFQNQKNMILPIIIFTKAFALPISITLNEIFLRFIII